MCGIFAYKGVHGDACQRVVKGLKKLEYRGYDSWGVAWKEHDGTIKTYRKVGKIGSAPEVKFPKS
ncbi:MAG: Isomerizing Glutamine-fructose-6-phosphate aminotransferase, partial [Candidatus Peregrinibacteria bacterium GW2011_GWA2_47_7]